MWVKVILPAKCGQPHWLFQLGSGVPRILQAYSKDCFKFADNYLHMTFPATKQVTTQVEELIKRRTNRHE